MQIRILNFSMKVLNNTIYFVFLKDLVVCNKNKLIIFILIAQSITNHQ
jgi:hypothetical protein